MAEQSKTLFKSRKQTISRCDVSQDEAAVEIVYEGVLAKDFT